MHPLLYRGASRRHVLNMINKHRHEIQHRH
jgi:hypothetical protein